METTTFFFLKSMQIDSTTLYLQNGKCTTTLPLKNRKWPKTVLPAQGNQVSTLYTNIGAPHTYNKQTAVCKFLRKVCSCLSQELQNYFAGRRQQPAAKTSIIIFYLHSLDHELCYFVISDFDLNSINICHWPSGCLFPI